MPTRIMGWFILAAWLDAVSQHKIGKLKKRNLFELSNWFLQTNKYIKYIDREKRKINPPENVIELSSHLNQILHEDIKRLDV